MPMIAYETLTVKGDGELNEDAVVAVPEARLFGVLDGVTSIVPYRNEKRETGGFIAANLVKERIESLADAEGLKERMEDANHLLRERMEGAAVNAANKEELWGTALAVLRIEENGAAYVQTGDCMILAVYGDGVRPLTRRQVSHLEASSLAKWREGVASGLNTRTALHAALMGTLRANRLRANAEGGYGVLNGDPDAVRFLEYGKINLTELRHLILLTDGLFWPEEEAPRGADYWRFTAERILDKGIERYAEELIGLEERDPECLRYARFKKSDDKTAVVIHIQ